MRLRRRPLLVAAVVVTMISVCGCSKPAEVPAGSSASASVDINVSDGDVSERVKTALLQSDSLKGMDITVVTTKGHLEKRSISEQDCDLFMKHDLNGRVLLPSRVVSLLYLVAALKNR